MWHLPFETLPEIGEEVLILTNDGEYLEAMLVGPVDSPVFDDDKHWGYGVDGITCWCHLPPPELLDKWAEHYGV